MPPASIACSPQLWPKVSSAAARLTACLRAVVTVPRAELCYSRTAIRNRFQWSNVQCLRILRSFARLTDAIVLLLTGAATAEVGALPAASWQPLRRRRPKAFRPLTRFDYSLGFALCSVRPTSCSSPPSTGSSTSCQERTLSLPCAAIHL